MADPRNNPGAILAYLDRAGHVTSAAVLARDFGVPRWQMYQALCQLRAAGRVRYVDGYRGGWQTGDYR